MQTERPASVPRPQATRGGSASTAAAWVESKHPRANDGRFGHNNRQAAGASAPSAARPSVAGIANTPKNGVRRQISTKPATPVAANLSASGEGTAENPTYAQRLQISKKSQKAIKRGFVRSGADPAYMGIYTKEERSAVVSYGANSSPDEAESFEAINRALTGRSTAGKAKQAISRKAAEVVNRAISHSPIKEAVELYRGGVLPPGIKPGDVMSSPALMSTSQDRKAAEKYLQADASHGLLIIKALPGARALDMNKAGTSIFQNEREMLIGSHQQMHVLSVKTDKQGRKVVTVQMHGPEQSLKASSGAVVSKSVTSQKELAPKKAHSKGFKQRVTADVGLRIHKGERPALGAAFSHARKVEAETGGGQKKQHEVAARYLKKKKMPAMQKAAPGTLGAYQSAIAQASAPGHMSDDDKYAMDAYRRMFDRNRQGIAQARAEAFARMLAAQARR